MAGKIRLEESVEYVKSCQNLKPRCVASDGLLDAGRHSCHLGLCANSPTGGMWSARPLHRDCNSVPCRMRA